MDYQEIADEVLGQYSPHRTLRTLFDPLSDEWSRTTVVKKLEILEKVLQTKKITLPELLMQYRYYYEVELSNKAYVVDAIPDALELLLQHAILKKSL